MGFLNFLLAWFNLQILGDQPQSKVLIGVGGNTSVHTQRPFTMFGRRFLLDRRIPVDIKTIGAAKDGKLRVADLRFGSIAEMEEALEGARRSMVVNDKGVFVSIDVPAIYREHSTDNPPLEVLLTPQPGQNLHIQY